MTVRQIRGTWCVLLLLPLLAGCPDKPPEETDGGTQGETDAGQPPEDAGTDGGVLAAREYQTHGGAIAMSPDQKVALAANRTAESVAVFSLSLAGTPPTASRTALLPVAGEPWAAVVSNDGTTGYVVLRRAQKVIRVKDLGGTPVIDGEAATGSEPTGIAISPTGTSLYVANWSEGTVTFIRAADMTVTRTVDLNAALAQSGMLGTVAPRPGLAHPRALVVTNDGDDVDGDETIYVTEFFSQARTDTLPADDTEFDVARQGVIYQLSAEDGAVGSLITLAPTADTGFADSNSASTGCFPNQLLAAAIAGSRLYVTGVCASPLGPAGGAPANFKTEVHSALYAVDLATRTQKPEETVLLTRAFEDLYDAASIPDDGTRRMPLIPNDLSFVPESRIGYVTSYGSDAVFRVRFNADGGLAEVGSTVNPFINLAPGGRLPLGIAVSRAGTALVLNEFTRSVSILSFASQAPVGDAVPAADPATGSAQVVNLGKRFFVTGLGRWSLRGQGWNSCETCHPDGLTDNVTWFFARGPRQTTSLDGTYAPDGQERRILNWTGIFDEVHDFELNTRGNSGGVGAIVHANSNPAVAADRIVFDGSAPAAGQLATATSQAGLNGSTQSLMPGGATTPKSVLADWDEIDTYVRTIRAPKAPKGLDSAAVQAGRTLFVQNGCAGCHGGQNWTISRVFFTPSEANNHPTTGGLILQSYTRPTGFPSALNPPTSTATSATLRRSPADGANDQLNCVLRAVGTFPATLDAEKTGVVPPGAPRVKEVRQNMTADAQGASGFNPPSLRGMNTGAPYFHAGNARTLEEAFSETFQGHYKAFSANFLDVGDRDAQVRQLVSFLLSIDDDAAPVTNLQGSLPYNPVLCPQAFP